MIHLCVFILTLVALTKWTKGWLRIGLIAFFVLAALVIAL